MIALIDKINCCGCEACVQACALNCITMEVDREGFWYPVVNGTICVNCGACDSACPMLNPKEKPEDISVYAARCVDVGLRQASSSGGVFSLLAEKVLEAGGTLFGAAFGGDFSVFHTMVRKTEELEILRGSKYVQSRIGNTYQQAEQFLKTGNPVLFTGTSCQVAGLKAYLGKEYDKLYTVDILCHGVPSPAVWEKYLQEQEIKNGSKIQDVSFRNKAHGWHRFSMRVQFENEKIYNKIHHDDAFMKLFLENICLRPSCYDCKFRESRSGSDLTIGDAWGIETWMPEMDDDRGTSVVVVNTEKGRQLLAEIQPEAEVCQVDIQRALNSNAVYHKSVKPHPKRDQFFAALEKGAFPQDLVQLCKKPLRRRVLSFGKRVIKKILGRG